MKVYVIGDSISLQYGPYLKNHLDGEIHYDRKSGEQEALLNLDNPRGSNGGNSSMVLTFLRAQEQAGGIDADLLLLNCGLHDIKTDLVTKQKHIQPDEYKTNLQAIIQQVHMMGIQLVWMTTTSFDEATHNRNPKLDFSRHTKDDTEYHEIALQVMRNAQVPLLDLRGFTSTLGDDIYCDHVHFHDHVRQKQAAFIAGWLMAYRDLK